MVCSLHARKSKSFAHTAVEDKCGESNDLDGLRTLRASGGNPLRSVGGAEAAAGSAGPVSGGVVRPDRPTTEGEEEGPEEN